MKHTFLFYVIILLSVTGHAFAQASAPAVPSATRDLSNARQIANACRLYSTDHQGSFPNNLEELLPNYLPDRGLFSSPLAPKPGQLDFEYFGAGLKDSDAPDKILLRGRYTTENGERSVVRVDLSGKLERQVSTQAQIDVHTVSKLAAALAAAYANNEARRQFEATPFSGSASVAVLRLNRWEWQAIAGFGKGDLRASVSFKEDGSDPKVELETLVNEASRLKIK